MRFQHQAAPNNSEFTSNIRDHHVADFKVWREECERSMDDVGVSVCGVDAG